MVASQQKLYAHAMKLTRNPHNAEDLVQETMAKAMLNESKYEPDTNLGGWLYTMLRNIFLSDMRKVRTSYHDPHDLVDAIAVEENQLMKVQATDMDRILGELHPDHREAIQLLIIDDLTYEEAAAKTGVAVGTLKSRVHRARKQIVERFEGHDDDLRTGTG